jgi:hypothetical protein
MRSSLARSRTLVVVLAGLLAASVCPIPHRTVGATVAGTCAVATPVVIATPPAADSDPPWGVQHVTTPELTADRFKQALPCAFARYQLVDVPPVLATRQIYPFATESENLRYYYGPELADVPFAAVNISTLPPELTPAAAIGQIRTMLAQEPGFLVDAEDTAADTAVPFMLLQQSGGEAAGPVWTLVWGASGADLLFTVSALERQDLEILIRLLVANLEGLPETPATPGSR